MIRKLTYLAGLLAILVWPLGSVGAKVRVVASIPSLAALAKAVGGKHVQVTSLGSAVQDPHFIDSRPSYVVHLNRADLLIYVGADLEVGWLPPLVTNARNGRIQAGQPGHLNAATVCGPMLNVPTGDVDRRMGDVHVAGNPHYLYDPHYGLRVAQAITQRLVTIDGKHVKQYRTNMAQLKRKLTAKIAVWEKLMKPYQGRTIVGYHQSLIYLTTWLKIKRGGFIEPVPGIRPNPRHLARLILYMRRNQIRVVVSEPWYNAQVTRVVARRTQSVLVRLPGDVGASGIKSYTMLIDRIVRSLHKAFRSTATGK